jgi:hypothetical protein
VTLAVGFGPALSWATWMTLRYEPLLGRGRSVALAWTPWILERAGFHRGDRWLRRYWDEDAR